MDGPKSQSTGPSISLHVQARCAQDSVKSFSFPANAHLEHGCQGVGVRAAVAGEVEHAHCPHARRLHKVRQLGAHGRDFGCCVGLTQREAHAGSNVHLGSETLREGGCASGRLIQQVCVGSDTIIFTFTLFA